jgi:hypothetical protein
MVCAILSFFFSKTRTLPILITRQSSILLDIPVSIHIDSYGLLRCPHWGGPEYAAGCTGEPGLISLETLQFVTIIHRTPSIMHNKPVLRLSMSKSAQLILTVVTTLCPCKIKVSVRLYKGQSAHISELFTPLCARTSARSRRLFPP